MAGNKTSSSATANLIMYLSKAPECKAKLFKEFTPVMEAAQDDILNKLDFESVMDLDYLGYCLSESLRMEPPTFFTMKNEFLNDVRLSNGLVIKAGTPWIVNQDAVSHEAKSWQKPYEFIPERFDTSSPYYKRPDGGVRNPLASSPFYGGHRICIGKTFVEIAMRYMIPIVMHHMDFDKLNDGPKQQTHVLVR